MAAVNEDISDRELRAKLKENGISCGPITATTKNLYIRKLNKKLSENQSSTSTIKAPSRKSLSPKSSPRRSPSRRSVDPTTSPGRKLIGFSSDEDEPAKTTAVSRQKRLSGQFKANSKSPPASGPSANEERPMLRKRAFNTSSPKGKLGQEDERTDIDDRINTDSHGFAPRRGKLPSYTGLRNLFMRKSMEDSRNFANASTPPPEMPYDLEVEDEEADSDVYQYTWLIWLLAIVVVFVFFLIYNWQAFSLLLWKSTDHENLKICGPAGSHENENGCLKEEDIMKKLVEKLQYELGETLGLFKCGHSSKGGEMTQEDLLKWLKTQLKDRSVRPNNIQVKIIKWIREHSDSGLRCFDEKGVIITNTSQAFAKVQTEVALKPLMCRIQEAFSRVFYQLLFLCAAIICCLCIYFIVKYRWMLRERRTRQMFELVDKILDVLKNHHNECQKNKDLSPYLAIPHVRDMLIKPSEREAMKSAWDDAVKFLSAQESRVRVESQRIAGEDFEVWRLLHHSPGSPSSPSGSNAKQGKVWQGTAFENFTTAVNPPLISPTPCLKIRNMFEPVMETVDQWHVFIQDAILEKCNEKGAAIVHISVDKASNEGCVYVKCANHRSSGAAFRAIHGCWFDGRLVTVKFLTLKRYHQRFPVSIEAKELLKPSGMSSSTIPKLQSEPVNESDSDSDS